MAGQIRKRGDRAYFLRVYIGRHPDTGKRIEVSKTVRGTKRQAEQVLTAMLRAKDMGTLVEPVKMSLNTLLDKWLASSVKPRVRDRTHRDYAAIADRYIRPTLGNRLITQIKPMDVQIAYAKLIERPLSPRTIRHCHAVLHNAFEQAVKWQLLANNPTSQVDLPRAEHREMQAMSEEEAQRFLSAAENDTHHAVFALLLGTGMRPSEAAGLKWDDLDIATRTLSVRRTIVRPKGSKWRFGSPKTKRGNRTIALPESLVVTLLKRKESGPYSEHGLMFPSLSGDPLDMNNLRNRNFATIIKRAGLSEVYNLYSLRHTHATLLLAAGVHPKVVSERLGHATVSITLDVYSHVLPNMQKEASDKLEAILFNQPKNKENALAFN